MSQPSSDQRTRGERIQHHTCPGPNKQSVRQECGQDLTGLGSHLSRIYNHEAATDPGTSHLECRNKKVLAICQSCFCDFSILRLHPSVCQCSKRRLRRKTPNAATKKHSKSAESIRCTHRRRNFRLPLQGGNASERLLRLQELSELGRRNATSDEAMGLELAVPAADPCPRQREARTL